MLVFPQSKQVVMDLVLVCGLGTGGETGQKVSKSCAALRVASSVRSIRRLIQSLVAKVPDSAPMNCPRWLLNDNVDQTQRVLASSYYAHVCALDLPFFDQELLEGRSFLFFKFFEEHLDSLKLQIKSSFEADGGVMAGQWYEIDGRVLEAKQGGISVAKSSVGGTSAKTPAKSRSGVGSQLKGIFFFFLGIVVEDDQKFRTTAKNPAQASMVGLKMTPVMLSAQLPDLQVLADDLAEVGVRVEEATRLDQGEGDGDAGAKDAGDGGKSSKKKPAGQKPKADQPETARRHQQSAALLKQAEVQWIADLDKVGALVNKSNRILQTLLKQTDRWPAEVKMGPLDILNANALAKFFNPAYGINDKAAAVGEWLISSSSGAAAVIPEGSLK
jgi:hypothetical protein